MSITASVTSPQIAATVAEAGVSVSVDGGSSVNAVVTGGIGPTGPAGGGGGGGSTAWDDITGKPSTFPPDRRATVTVGRSEADYIATGTLGSPTDHSTIQSAINAVQTAGGGTVFIKAGVYFLGATVNITAANVQLIGAGRGTELRAVGDYGNVLNCAITPAPTSWPGLSGLVIESIRFESTVERTSGCAIYAQRTHNAVIRDVYLADLTYGVAYGLTTPAPPAFYIGIWLDGQDQCLIDNVVGCAVHRGIKINGWHSASADFAYDGMVSNCKLWGSVGEKRGIAIDIGPASGGLVLDFNSLNQWDYALRAIHYTGSPPEQGGGIITIRGGYAENDEHGYHLVGWQNVVVDDLWASLHVVDCSRTIVLGAANPGPSNCSIEVELRRPSLPVHSDTGMVSPSSCECLIFGNADAFATNPFGSVIDIKQFHATSVVFEGDSRLTNARTPTAHNHAASDITSGTLAAARLPGVPVYLQEATPTGSGWVHFKTNGSGDVIDIITG